MRGTGFESSSQIEFYVYILLAIATVQGQRGEYMDGTGAQGRQREAQEGIEPSVVR